MSKEDRTELSHSWQGLGAREVVMCYFLRASWLPACPGSPRGCTFPLPAPRKRLPPSLQGPPGDGAGLSPSPCAGPMLLASRPSFPVSNALWCTPPVTWLSGLPWEGLSGRIPCSPFHNPSPTFLSNSHFLCDNLLNDSVSPACGL